MTSFPYNLYTLCLDHPHFFFSAIFKRFFFPLIFGVNSHTFFFPGSSMIQEKLEGSLTIARCKEIEESIRYYLECSSDFILTSFCFVF